MVAVSSKHLHGCVKQMSTTPPNASLKASNGARQTSGMCLLGVFRVALPVHALRPESTGMSILKNHNSSMGFLVRHLKINLFHKEGCYCVDDFPSEK